jgi:hypothetical protein
MRASVVLGIFFLVSLPNVRGQAVRLSGFGPDDASTSIRMALHSPNDTIIIDKAVNPWSFRPIRFQGVRNKTIIIEPGVRIQAVPGAFPRTSDALFTFIDSDNVTILGNENILSMNKEEYTKGEWRHVLGLWGCRNFSVENLVLRDSGGDGIYVAGSGSRLYSENIRILKVKSLNNKRQGISVISAKGLYVTNSEFSDTTGTLPGAGVDIEPNNPRNVIDDINFEHCVFRNNYNSGIKISLGKLTSSSKPVNISFSDCLLQKNHAPENPRIAAEISIGAHRSDPVKGNVLFRRCTVNQSSWGILYSRKAADAFRVSFDQFNAFDICQNETIPPIYLEVSDYRNPSLDLGGFHFKDTFLQFPPSLPLLVVRGSRMGTLNHLRDMVGTITYSGIPRDTVKFINYDPSNNINFRLKIINK